LAKLVVYTANGLVAQIDVGKGVDAVKDEEGRRGIIFTAVNKTLASDL
jgi:hypothetical protein